MKLIPLISTKNIKKRKQIADLFSDLNASGRTISITYLLDISGIKKNHPSLSLHQYTHRWFDTIVDAGPRNIGDVVDVLLAGAKIVVLRPRIWIERDILNIRNISESEIYAWYDPLNQRRGDESSLLFSQADGVILNLDRLSNPLSFDIRSKIKELKSSRDLEKIIVYDPMKKHVREIQSYGFKTIIVDSEIIIKDKDLL